jgi:Protein of Unknown function (DUF2784)
MAEWAILADAVVIFHAAYVAFVVVGCAAILVGVAREWEWVRGLKFRVAHLIAIAFVFVESIVGAVCPLTILENALRARAGQARYPGDFVGYWAHRLIFYEAPSWMFTALYAALTVLVAAGFWLAPPRFASAPSTVRNSG